jgi:hypothetical protein
VKDETLQIRTKTLKTLMIVIRYLDDERESADERCKRKGLRKTAARTT